MAIRVIKAAAGLGKTSMLLKLLEDTLYGKVEIYVPTHELGEQISDSLEKSLNHVVIKGRSHPYGNGQRMCARYNEAQLLIDKGYPVYPVLCAKRDDRGHVEECEHYARCPYIAQFEGPEQVFIYTHASLPLRRGPLEQELPQLAVIDESFFKSCIDILVVPIADLTAVPSGSATETVCAAIRDILQAGNPLLDEFSNRGLGTRLPLALEETKLSLPHFSPWWPDAKQAKVLSELAARPRIRELLETLQFELATGRAESHSFALHHKAKAILVHRRLPITRFTSGKGTSDVLILDADADPLIVAQWFPGAGFEVIPVDRKAYVIQCTSTRCATTSLVPDPKRHKDATYLADAAQRVKDLQMLIDRKAESGRRVLVVGPQAVTGNLAAGIPPLVTVPVGSELAHFNAIRGVDRWKNLDVAIIVGRNQPPIESAEGLARAIWFDDPQPLTFSDDWEVEKRGYRVRSGMPPNGIEVLAHPDRRVQAVVEQLRERESAQAIDRLRLIHAAKPKEVILLSNIPLDIDVDEFRSWTEITYGTRLERAWAQLNGVMPLAPAWLAGRFPGLWASEAAAETDVRGLAKNREFTNRVSIRNSTVYTFRYQGAGQRRPSHALSVLLLDATHDELTRLVEKPLIIAEFFQGVPGEKRFGAIGEAVLEPLDAEGNA